jgi:hypothetical protein
VAQSRLYLPLIIPPILNTHLPQQLKCGPPAISQHDIRIRKGPLYISSGRLRVAFSLSRFETYLSLILKSQDRWGLLEISSAKPLESHFSTDDTLIRNIKFHIVPLSYHLCLTKDNNSRIWNGYEPDIKFLLSFRRPKLMKVLSPCSRSNSFLHHDEIKLKY